MYVHICMLRSKLILIVRTNSDIWFLTATAPPHTHIRTPIQLCPNTIKRLNVMGPEEETQKDGTEVWLRINDSHKPGIFAGRNLRYETEVGGEISMRLYSFITPPVAPVMMEKGTKQKRGLKGDGSKKGTASGLKWGSKKSVMYINRHKKLQETVIRTIFSNQLYHIIENLCNLLINRKLHNCKMHTIHY